MLLALCAHHQEVKILYTASGIITPIGGSPVHKSSLNLCTGRPPIGVIPFQPFLSQIVHRTATYRCDPIPTIPLSNCAPDDHL